MVQTLLPLLPRPSRRRWRRLSTLRTTCPRLSTRSPRYPLTPGHASRASSQGYPQRAGELQQNVPTVASIDAGHVSACSCHHIVLVFGAVHGPGVRSRRCLHLQVAEEHTDAADGGRSSSHKRVLSNAQEREKRRPSSMGNGRALKRRLDNRGEHGGI